MERKQKLISLLFVIGYYCLIGCRTKPDYLDSYSIRINGKIKFVDSYKNVVAALGKPDSIRKGIPVNGSYHHRPFNCAYFRNVTFEKYGDSLVLNTIEFKSEPNSYLQTPILKLNGSTKLSTVESILLYKDALRGTDDRHTTIFVFVAKQKSNDKWVLYFNDATNLLYHVEYWRPGS